MTGYPYEQAVGRPVWEFLADPKEIDFIKRMFPLDWNSASESTFENRWSDGDEHNRLISWSNSIMGDPKGKGTARGLHRYRYHGAAKGGTGSGAATTADSDGR